MSEFEMESWYVTHGKEKEHDAAMRDWLMWVRDHRELFKEWKSVRYFVKHIAGADSDRHFLVWEYDSLADYEAYKKRRADYTGPYAEYKKHDPYHTDVFDHTRMGLEFWRDKERDLWIESPVPGGLAAVPPPAGANEQVTFLYYPDLKAPRSFYGQTLGLKSCYDQEWVSIYRVATGAAVGVVKAAEGGVSRESRRDAAMISIVTSDVDGWYERLKNAPGVIVQKPVYNHTAVPIRAFLLQDPGGYSVEFFQWRKDTPR